MSQYLDTRDLKKRQEELQDIVDAHEAWVEEHKEWEEAEPEDGADDAREAWEDDEPIEPEVLDEDDAEELKELDTLADEISEWSYGETLIPESEFTSYTEELADDIGAVSKDQASWIVIDWEATADNLKADYIEVQYQGTTYLVRA